MKRELGAYVSLHSDQSVPVFIFCEPWGAYGLDYSDKCSDCLVLAVCAWFKVVICGKYTNLNKITKT